MTNTTDKNLESNYRVNEQGMIVEEIDDMHMGDRPERLNSSCAGQPWACERKVENYE